MINEKDKKDYIKESYEFINKYPKEVGSKIFELEEYFCEYFGVKCASACSSGSTGLLLALKSLGIEKDDEVMLNCNYFISDPNSILICGAQPVFIDLGESINSLCVDDIKNKITHKTKAIILIHLYGYPIENTREIINLCKEKNIKVIEDCCQSIGAKIGEDYIGTMGDIGVFSFDSNKLVKGGEGGMIVSNNHDLIEKTRLYKNNCKKDGEFVSLGFNYRYNDFGAIYAKYSLKNLEYSIEERIKEAQKYGNDLYLGGKNIYPNYYNFLIKKEKLGKVEYKKDFYNIDYKKYKNLIKHLSEYEII